MWKKDTTKSNEERWGVHQLTLVSQEQIYVKTYQIAH